MATPADADAPLASASASVTLRLHVAAGDPTAIGRVTTAVGEVGCTVVAIDMVETAGEVLTVDLMANAHDDAQAARLAEAVEALDGVHVHRISDRTFLLHLGGKLEVHPTVPLRTRDDLSMAYTPGVARICQAIARNPDDARRLTVKGNTVAIVTDGTAVLGLGDIGPLAALPVMEGKAALFKEFAGVDAWPVCLDTTDVDEIVRTVVNIAPAFGGINLEDIAAPRCFEIEERLRDALDIPVFHDDQHGTAIVVLAALHNALRVVGKRLEDVTVALIGTGAAGLACAKLLIAEGVGDLVAADRKGILGPDRDNLDDARRWFVEHANRSGRTGATTDVLDGADVFLGVSGPNLFAATEIRRMAVDPVAALEHAAVVATGRSDHPNQINNVLAFPGVFRGALDARARFITDEMKIAAARAIADVITDEELRPSYIIPSVFNPAVTEAVADAVRREAERTGV